MLVWVGWEDPLSILGLGCGHRTNMKPPDILMTHCCLCDKYIGFFGCLSWPLVPPGDKSKCCDACDQLVVVPARLMLFSLRIKDPQRGYDVMCKVRTLLGSPVELKQYLDAVASGTDIQNEDPR